MGKFLIDLNTFKVIKKTDLGKEEPYLWLFGIAIELGVGSSNDPTRFIIKRPSTPGNLGAPFKKGESRAIPDSIGRIEKDVEPVLGATGARVRRGGLGPRWHARDRGADGLWGRGPGA